MAKTTSVALDDQSAGFVDQQIESGRFTSASEAVNAGLRLLEDHEAKVKALREAIDKGEQSGFIEDFDFDDFLRDMNAEYAQKGKAAKA